MGINSELIPLPYELFFEEPIFMPTIEPIILDDSFIKNLYDTRNITKESTNITDIFEKKIILKNKIFEITKTKKRLGRKRKEDLQKSSTKVKSHSKYEDDNVIRKIQIHFLNYLISFTNEILMHFGSKKKFLNIDYSSKKNVKKEYVESLKSKEIGQILSQIISTKYKRQYNDDKEKNNKLYAEVTKNAKYDSVKKILSETYLYIFMNYYYENKKDLNEYGLNIKLSNKVKTYKDLLEKHNEDSKYIAKIEKIVKENYLPEQLFINN